MTQVWFSDLDGLDAIRDYASADAEGLSSDEDIAAGFNWQGDPVPPVAIPKGIRQRTKRGGALSELNLIRNRFLVIGPKLATLLKGYDLGAGNVYPLDVYDADGNMTSSGQFYFWNFGNVASHLMPEQSQELKKSNFGYEKPGEHVYYPPIFPKDDTIALSRDCLVGPDVWRERFLHKGTFLSDRLAQGLKEAGLARKFKLVRCRVI
ncbi:hypothetical protein TRM7557_00937 [Tritonibacter multivorans]|uniref:Uncharacterized protein n=1 Tax=Tritonibacter multivorans TaxID=928856 RepID=A0A0P1G401_9RHOB|nr:hypothetical protein [Tritonibacter multivorans]MDA7421954.1 hypothetical protein [Tritonibacter multivorans]CUH76514.1 hypothetical protein TRM7557_00937 [Tritonibacter multivorans]SFD46463.1 hypothetical protein SAMN04488049_1146 [Tritonibacter multivorans]